MITKEQLKILGIFLKNLFKSLTFVELKNRLKESSNSKLQRAILNFKAENLIDIKKNWWRKLFKLILIIV